MKSKVKKKRVRSKHDAVNTSGGDFVVECEKNFNTSKKKCILSTANLS